MADDVEALLKRAQRAEGKRDAFAALMRDVYAFALPERDAWGSYGIGADRHTRVFDSTAVVATSRFANRLQQALFPPQQRWARLTLPPEFADVPELEDIKVGLEDATGILFAHLHASNFDMVINEWAQELAAGTAALLVENGRNMVPRRSWAPILRFTAVPAAKVAFDEGPFGGVEGVFYDQEATARNVPRLYPEANRLPDAIAAALRDDPEKVFTLKQCVTYDAKADLYRFQVIEPTGKDAFVERSYRTMPWIITRWTKAPGETHGRGPLTQALPDIRTVNKLVELALIAGSFAVSPVWTVEDDGVVNPATVRIVPGAVLPVRSNGGPGGRRSIAPLEFPGDLTVNDALREAMTTRIRQVLFDDPLPPQVQVGLTATEVVERIRRFQQDTGAFGRLHVDAAAPIVTRCLDILQDAGELADQRFHGLMEAMKDQSVRIRASSPLAQAQDQADVQAVMTFLQGSMQLGEIGALMVRRGLKLKDLPRWVAERTGVPQKLIPTTEEIEAEEAAEREQAAAQSAMQSPVVAQVAGQVAKAATAPAQAPEPMRPGMAA